MHQLIKKANISLSDLIDVDVHASNWIYWHVANRTDLKYADPHI